MITILRGLMENHTGWHTKMETKNQKEMLEVESQ